MRTILMSSVMAVVLAVAAHPAQAAGVRMYVRHDVTDYAAWRKVYDADTNRKHNGVTAQAVYQSADNPNDVTVTHDFKTVEAAKAFAASPDLKAAMAKAGVKGTPQIWFTTLPSGPAAQTRGVRMFVRHDVSDYATWRKGYDGFDATRKEMGVMGQAVYQSADNPNDVTVTHDFKTVEAAKAFEESPELFEAMAKAGVKNTPQAWITTQAAK